MGHGLAVEHADNSGEMSEWVAGGMGQRVQRGSLSSIRAPGEEEVGEARVGRREALGQDADLQECALAGRCSSETQRVRSSPRKRDDRRDGEVGWGSFGDWECLK